MRISVLFVALAVMASGFGGCKSSQKTAAIPAPLLNQEALSTDGDPMLLGRINRDGLTRGAFAEWFNPEYNDYKVNVTALAPVQGKLQELSIEVFMGTWCSDSRREVPRFYKILDHLQVNAARLTVIAVDDHPDRRKTSPQGEEKGKDIEYVPTFIFLRGGAEVGRIVESPQVSLEDDMAAILLK